MRSSNDVSTSCQIVLYVRILLATSVHCCCTHRSCFNTALPDSHNDSHKIAKTLPITLASKVFPCTRKPWVATDGGMNLHLTALGSRLHLSCTPTRALPPTPVTTTAVYRRLHEITHPVDILIFDKPWNTSPRGECPNEMICFGKLYTKQLQRCVIFGTGTFFCCRIIEY